MRRLKPRASGCMGWGYKDWPAALLLRSALFTSLFVPKSSLIISFFVSFSYFSYYLLCLSFLFTVGKLKNLLHFGVSPLFFSPRVRLFACLHNTNHHSLTLNDFTFRSHAAVHYTFTFTNDLDSVFFHFFLVKICSDFLFFFLFN